MKNLKRMLCGVLGMVLCLPAALSVSAETADISTADEDSGVFIDISGQLRFRLSAVSNAQLFQNHGLL